MSDDASIPSQEEIAQLPRWARVAFAARCARRVFPLISGHCPGIPREDLATLLAAVIRVEQAAATGRCPPRQPDYCAIRCAGHKTESDSPVAGSASFAVFACLYATDVGSKGSTSPFYAAKADPSAVPAMRRDYERLAQQTRSEAWTDDTPVPPFVFDPLDNSDPTLPGAAFVLSLFAPANTDPHVIGDGVMKLWEAANEYHMARGGGVLTFDQFKQMMPALVPVGPLVGS